MKTRARIVTWQRLRQQPTWKLLAADNAPLTAGLLQSLLLDAERQLPASLLMDEATLLAHSALWVTEPQPYRADVIEHLDAAEQALYRDLRGDRWGVRVRLEQERIGWDVAWARISSTLLDRCD